MVAPAQRTRKGAPARRARLDAAHGQARPTKNYTDNAELSGLIQAWQKRGKGMGREKQARLIEVLYKIAGGVWDRYEFTQDRDDFCQDVILNYFDRGLKSIDTEKNCFSYLTTCAVNFGMKRRNVEINTRRAEFDHGANRLVRHFAEC